MSDPAPPISASDAGLPGADDTGLRVTLLIIYGLFLLALVNGITAVAGVVVAYIVRGSARGTVWEGHVRNIVHVFWISAVTMAVVVAIFFWAFGGLFLQILGNLNTAPNIAGFLFLVLPFMAIVLVVFTVWYLYRILRGVIRALEDKAY